MKKLLTAGLVLLSVATLAACGNKSSDSASKVSSTTEQTSASSKTDNSKTNTSEVTLLTDEEIDKAKTIGDIQACLYLLRLHSPLWDRPLERIIS